MWSNPKKSKLQVCNKHYYRISANSCRDNYSFLEVWVRQLFKGDNYSREEIIGFLIFGSVHNLNYCHTMYVKVSKSQKIFSLNSIAQKTNEMLGKILSYEAEFYLIFHLFFGQGSFKKKSFWDLNIFITLIVISSTYVIHFLYL